MTGLLGDKSAVPLLDLASGNEVAQAALLDAGLRKFGFVAVRGHGISSELMEGLHQDLLHFFHLPAAVKAKYASERPGDSGWVDQSDVGGSGALELCEIYAADPWGEPGAPTEGMSAAAQAMLVRSNKWPEEEVPLLRDKWLDFYEAAERPADYLLRLAAIALGEPEESVSQFHRNPVSPMIANWYPPQPAAPATGRVRKGAHSDWGSLTLVWHDGTPGLQFQVDNTWIPADAPAGSLVVNSGDLLARWTNDRWRAAVHRVVNPTGPYARRERLSIVWFGLPDYDAVIRTLPSCVLPEGGASKYRPVVCGDWYSGKMRDAYDLQARLGGQNSNNIGGTIND
jgi:isopenicillin N synthase-like dioxygenase